MSKYGEKKGLWRTRNYEGFYRTTGCAIEIDNGVRLWERIFGGNLHVCANSDLCLVEHVVFKRSAGTVAITGRGDTSHTSDLQFLATMHLQLLITVEGMCCNRRRGRKARGQVNEICAFMKKQTSAGIHSWLLYLRSS